MNKIILISLLVLILFVNNAYSLDFSALVGKYYMLAIVGLMLSIIISSLAYMVGSWFQIPTAKAFAKEEIGHLLFTVFLIMFLAGALLAYQQFSASLAKGTFFSLTEKQIKTGECPDGKKFFSKQNRPENAFFRQIDWFLGCIPILEEKNIDFSEIKKMQINANTSAKDILNKLKTADTDYGIMLSHVLDMYIGILAFEMILGPFSTLGFSTYLPEGIIMGIDISLSPLAGLTLISESLILLANIVGFGLVNIIVQKVLLKFIYVTMFDFFLPLGIAFRCVPFLRKTGSAIIALVIAAYFIYPITLWINEQIYFNALFEDKKPLLLNWVDYETVIGGCMPKKEGETIEQYYQRVREKMEKLQEQIKNTQYSDKEIYANTDPRYPTGQQKTVIERFASGLGKNLIGLSLYLFNIGEEDLKNIFNNINSPLPPIFLFLKVLIGVFTVPFRTEYFFSILLDQYIVAGQWVLVNLLFLVNSILITIILYKNITEAIGGDLKLFGIGRLL
ncbi:MAG: hypothetical protein N3D10_01625 [Candidatus Micrarchaeota archaeon]|nr:hypothetical protein [Candidatus Micrarchaeota archaeon]